MTPSGSPAPSGKAAANRAAAETQGSIEAPPPDSRTEADAGFSDGVINRKVPVVRLTRLVLDWKPGCKPPRFRVLSGGNGRSDALVQLQHGSVTRTSPCVSFPDSTSPPSDCEGECSSSSPSSSSVPAASSLQRPGAASEPRPGRGREERPRVEGSMHCTSCRTRGQLALCCECGRGFHAQCHVPPLLRLLSAQWKCMLCRDFSEEYKYEFSPKSETPGLSLLDQKKCSHLLLTLYCHKASPSLYKPPSPVSDLGSYVDLTLIRGRLLRKLSPSYCRPEDFVADIWLLLSNVLKHSQKSRVTRTVAVLRSSFPEKLRDTFGDALDPRYLEPEICLSISRKRGNGETSCLDNEESQSKRIRPELSEKT
ncbi:transcription intermediary factor 1-beta-like [Acipenser ruthenus]|uniref:transcription intermediary factor 1-beta-like n=1 Tax=Acipenser ruthenus TaxID=7906 RepID=UPI002742430E|nr:transcription intermediary factor 1-beta-like [Acipenser ruthenus]